MTSCKRIMVLILLGLASCTAAKDPLAGGNTASFAIIPGKLHATAELSQVGPDSLGKPRAQTLHFDVCLQSLATGQSVAAGSNFVVADGRGGERKRDADAEGCIHWDEEHAVEPLAPERNVRVERQIRANGNHRGTVGLVFNVKPWLDGPGAVQSALNQQQFGNTAAGAANPEFNSKYPVSPAGGPLSAEVDTTTHFDLADNRLELTYVEVGQGSDFEIDQFLKLSVPYRFNYAFSPRVVRQVFSGAVQSEPITAAKLRVTFVFFASNGGEPGEDARYLTSVQVDAKVGANGRVVGSLLLKYPHMLFASGRQTVLMQIASPTRSDIAPRSFSGSVPVIDNKGAVLVLDDGRDAEALHRDGQRARTENSNKRAKPLDEFLATHDVIRTDVGDFPPEALRGETKSILSGLDRTMISREELTEALGHDELDLTAFGTFRKFPLPARLCQTYARMNPQFKFRTPINDFKTDYLAALGANESQGRARFCQDDEPDRHRVIVQQLAFVDRLESPVPRNVFIHTYGNQDFGIFYSKDTSDVFSAGFGVHVPEIIPGRLGKMLSVIDLFATGMRNQTFSKRGTFGQSQTMAIDAGEMEISASVRNCVLITAVKAPFTQKPWLICESAPRPAAWHKENFFYYSQIFGTNHSPFIDPYNPRSGIKLLVRSIARMKHQTESLQNTDYRKTGFTVFVNAHSPSLGDFDTLGKLDELTDQSVPGAFDKY